MGRSSGTFQGVEVKTIFIINCNIIDPLRVLTFAWTVEAGGNRNLNTVKALASSDIC